MKDFFLENPGLKNIIYFFYIYGRYWKELDTVRHKRLFIQLAIVVSIKFPNVSVCKLFYKKKTLKERGLIYLYLISGWYLTNQVTVRHERLFIQLAINELCSGQSTSTIGLRFCCGNMSPIVLGIKKHLHHRLIAHCTFRSNNGL